MKYKYNVYNKSVSDEELLSDLKKVFDVSGADKLTMKQYSYYGKYNCSTFLRRFGSWNKALEKIKIPLTQQYWTELDLFKNIENVWIQKGSQPRRSDMNDKNLSAISSGAYLRHFGTWSDTLKAFIKYVNAEERLEQNKVILQEKRNCSHITKRDINLRLRFKVFQRDNFKCRICGASPAMDSSVQLHVDHIKPYSKGGETVLDNLQTLCSKCNLGKSDLDIEH